MTETTRIENDGYGEYPVPTGTDGLTEFERTTLGTWARGEATITAVYFDVGHVRVTNNAGGDVVHTVRDWMRMYDHMRDCGYTRRTYA